MKNLEPCKICGKTPKVIFDGNGNCIVRCKPFLKRTHWSVEAPTAEEAETYWNDRMHNFEAFKATFRIREATE